MKRILIQTMIALTGLSILATYYRYIVLQDFSYDVKPVEEFTEDDF